MGLSFDRAGHQAADEIAAGNNIDDEGRCGGDDRGGHIDIIFDDAGRRVDDIVEGNRHRARLARGESRAEQEVIPDIGELVDDRDDENRRRIGQQNPPENLEKTRPVDLRSLDQLGRKGLKNRVVKPSP